MDDFENKKTCQREYSGARVTEGGGRGGRLHPRCAAVRALEVVRSTAHSNDPHTSQTGPEATRLPPLAAAHAGVRDAASNTGNRRYGYL